MPITIRQSRVIICEGDSDKAFFTKLIERRGLPRFDVFQPNEAEGAASGTGGYSAFLSGLSANPSFPSVSGILVAADNDLNPAESFRFIQNQIRRAGLYPIPEQPLRAARVPLYPPVVVMMLPWTEEAGGLETLCLEAIYEAHANLRPCIDEYCRCAGTTEWDQMRQSKMRLECLLAAICREEPAVTLSIAFKKSREIIPLRQRAFQHIADFLQNFDNLISAV